MQSVSWFRKLYGEKSIYAIPNGGKRGKIEAYKFKLEGVLKGVPDLFSPRFGFYVEMKKEKGGILSKEQKDMIEYLQECGFKTFVCKGFEDFKKQMSVYIELKNIS